MTYVFHLSIYDLSNVKSCMFLFIFKGTPNILLQYGSFKKSDHNKAHKALDPIDLVFCFFLGNEIRASLDYGEEVYWSRLLGI
jgi:hypothetical protein